MTQALAHKAMTACGGTLILLMLLAPHISPSSLWLAEYILVGIYLVKPFCLIAMWRPR